MKRFDFLVAGRILLVAIGAIFVGIALVMSMVDFVTAPKYMSAGFIGILLLLSVPLIINGINEVIGMIRRKTKKSHNIQIGFSGSTDTSNPSK